MSNEKFKNTDYFIGLDAGSNSVGFAVTDTSYNLLKFKGKYMWGSHIFSEGSTAEERRVNRNARKRLARRNERLALLRELFKEEIDKKDPSFFLRLEESYLYKEDKSEDDKNSLFNDPLFNDKTYKEKYPTVFHLRKSLIDGDESALGDIRLVFLALNHILKNRGHFLYSGDNISESSNISSVLNDLKDSFSSVFEESALTITKEDDVDNALRIIKKSERIDELKKIITSNAEKKRDLLLKMSVGYKVKAAELFDNEDYGNLPAIYFSNSKFEDEDLPQLESSLDSDEFTLVESVRALYGRSMLIKIIGDSKYLSYSKVALWEKNRSDLKKLKTAIKQYCSKEEYEDFFHGYNDGDTKLGTFSQYIGQNYKSGRNTAVKRCATEYFYKKIKSLLKEHENEEDVKSILQDIENENFLNLLISYRNSVLPHQLHKEELNKILENAEKIHPFLSKKDQDGLSVSEKIKELLTFRIPYYTGPLASYNNKNYWMVRKGEGKIYPWNFNTLVDEEKSGENFIMRMTNKCTYLSDENVVPKCSLLYQSYLVLNEINNIKVNDRHITVEEKRDIYSSLFKEKNNVTQKQIKELLINKGYVRKSDGEFKLFGLDEKIKSKLSSFIMFKKYLESGKLRESEVDEIIEILTIFSDGGKLAYKALKENFKNKLSEDEISEISRWSFKGWGALSKKFLLGIETATESGEIKNIMKILWDTNENLMEIINNDHYSFKAFLESQKKSIKFLDPSVLDDYRVSPSVKKQIWQTLRIVMDIRKVMGHDPKKVFIEVARENDPKKKGKRTKSRKEELMEYLKKKEAGSEGKEMIKLLSSNDQKYSESEISKRDKLYLYFTQLGKCMYTGNPINIEELFSKEYYDIDHIWPISKSNDDSLSNRVLVEKTANAEKRNDYPINIEIREKMTPFWMRLEKIGLINEEKLKRLVGNKALTEDDLSGFLNRQLVETRQNTKATADILRRYFKDGTKIVYSKASNVRAFRYYEDEKKGIKFDFPKSRLVNNLHHAKDAYLNIVAGNVLDTKYTDKFFFTKHSDEYKNLSKAFSYSVEGAWDLENNKSVKTVKDMMAINQIIYTVAKDSVTGELFDLQLVKKGAKKGVLPAKLTPCLREKLKKAEDKDAEIEKWVNKYGGYNSIKISHLALVEDYDKDQNRTVYLVRIPIIYKDILSSEEDILSYCKKERGLSDNARLLVPKIPFNTLFEINGMKMRVTGTSVNSLLLSSDIPLLLNTEETRYINRVERFFEVKKKEKDLTPDVFDEKITKEENEKSYSLLVDKCSLPIYDNRPASQRDKIQSSFDIFSKLDLEKQCFTILEMIKYLGMGNGMANLSCIKAKDNVGKLKSSSVFKNIGSLTLIQESPSGLFTHRRKLI